MYILNYKHLKNLNLRNDEDKKKQTMQFRNSSERMH
jgi:hypothetical protein